MSSEHNKNRVTGLGSVRQAQDRVVIDGDAKHLVNGVVIDGSKSRDGTNTGDIDKLQAGIILGKITASGKYAPSIIAATLNDEAAASTAIEVSVSDALALVAVIGTSGTFNLTGPPTAGGVVATELVTFTAVDTGTGVITVAATTAAFEAGSFIQPTDGSETFKVLIGNGFPHKVTDIDSNNTDTRLGKPVIGGQVLSENIINWPPDTSLQQYVKDQLNNVGLFTFSDNFEN